MEYYFTFEKVFIFTIPGSLIQSCIAVFTKTPAQTKAVKTIAIHTIFSANLICNLPSLSQWSTRALIPRGRPTFSAGKWLFTSNLFMGAPIS
jgi:hypothetical protein